jgi:O-antigen ligase
LLEPGLLALNFAILLLSGARTPLALASLLVLGVIIFKRNLMALAAAGAMLAVAILFLGQFSFIRAIDLVQSGQAGNLSNRDLIWPYFEAGITASPWLGWGVGAGKMVRRAAPEPCRSRKAGSCGLSLSPSPCILQPTIL